MRVTAKHALWLVPLLLMGCGHKTGPTQAQTLAPPIVDTPPPKPAPVSKYELPPPVMGEAPPATLTDTVPPPTEPVKKPVHRRKKIVPAPTQEAAVAAAAPATATPTTPSVSAIGELSGGASGDLRSQTIDSINATEKGVNSITRTLNDPEQKTAAQIREFLKQAHEALATGDVDGARTLVMKAKVLLTELNQ